MNLWSYESETDECPHCRADLFRQDSLRVNGLYATVEQDGQVWKGYETSLILDVAYPDVRCTDCDGEIRLLPMLEEA